MRFHIVFVGIVGMAVLGWTEAGTAGAESAGTSSNERPWTGYIRVDPPIVQKGISDIKLIYLNRCAGTCTLSPGPEDSRTNTSSIIQSTVSIPPFAYGDASWQALVECVRELYAPFDIEITDVDPGNTPHFEAIVAGNPGDAGFPSYVGGVAPFGCDIIPNSITYSFAGVWGNEPRIICEVVAQETAHGFGLDHEYHCPDPMTYLTDCGDKYFRDFDAACGENQPAACDCNRETQNSYQLLLAAFGPGKPLEVEITRPLDGMLVGQGFEIQASATYHMPLDRAELHIDGTLIDTVTAPPYVFTAPAELPEGPHELEVRVFSKAGAQGKQTITVHRSPPCTSASQCGDDQTCVEGRCVLGPGSPGGLGETCVNGEDCFSGFCGGDAAGTRYCVETCELGGNGCPCGFSCINAGAGGACWPGGNACDDGGCAVSPGGASAGAGRGSSPALPMVLGFAFGALFLRRRRD